jgi:L-lysine 6-transaminase
MAAVTLATPALRDLVVERLRTDEHVIMLGCGTRSLRFRPALTVTEAELAMGVAALDRVLARYAR